MSPPGSGGRGRVAPPATRRGRPAPPVRRCRRTRIRCLAGRALRPVGALRNRPRWRVAGSGERGSATAELAMGLPALLVLLLAGLFAVGAATTKLQCVDAAREVALAASRGEPGLEAGRQLAPSNADITVTISGDTVAATVRAPVPVLGARLPALSVDATAVAAVEPGFPGPHL